MDVIFLNLRKTEKERAILKRKVTTLINIDDSLKHRIHVLTKRLDHLKETTNFYSERFDEKIVRKDGYTIKIM